MKVMTVVGTRPEIIRLSMVMHKLDEYLDHIIVHTGQNYDYELNEIFFNDLKVRKPDHFLNADTSSAASTIGSIIIEFDKVLGIVKPDALLVLGDTNSCLAALPAKRRKIPIFHMEAGNRCFDDRVPEEINRRIVDHTADINLTYSDIAREHLIREGIKSDRVIKTGSPMNEILNYFNKDINNSKILHTLKLNKEKFFLLSFHREENIDAENNFRKIIELVEYLAIHFDYPVIISTHPRTRKKIDQEKIKFHKNVNLLKPLGFFDYNYLQKNALIVFSDSGTITEESSILNFPAINIRESHERPEGFEEGSVIMSGLDLEIIKDSISLIKDQPRGDHRLLRLVRDYDAPNVSDKVLRIILSYTKYVDRNVWKKY